MKSDSVAEHLRFGLPLLFSAAGQVLDVQRHGQRIWAGRLRPARSFIAAIVLGLSVDAANADLDWGLYSPYAERLHFFRFLEDYTDITQEDRAQDWFASIKKVPLDQDNSYLTFGGDYRYRYEYFQDALFGLLPGDDFELHLNRFMLHGDIHFGDHFRAFVQLSTFTESGRPFDPAPFDESDPDVQQAFFDIGSNGSYLRLGRQELVLGSGLLSDVREGPNQRQSFDAARLSLAVGAEARLDAFYAKDVLPITGAFEDTSRSGTEFWGVYGSNVAEQWAATGLDVYYFGIDRPAGIYDVGVARERRHSLGTRVMGALGAFSYEYEGIYQFGRFGALDIHAWGVRTEHYYTLSELPFTPRVGLIANATSGDSDPSDGTLGTFDALFPNPSYTTDASIFRPRNFYELHPVISVDVTDNFNLLLEANFLWRVRKSDAVYAVPGFPLVPGAASNERFIGAIFDVIGTWRISPHLTLQGTYVHAVAGDVIKDAGGQDVDFLLFQSVFKF
jgi:hypothetical protein